MSIELLFQEFEQYAQESHSLLTETLSIISEGKVPSRKDVSQLDLSIANLRAKYDCIYQAASEQLPTDEMPEDGAPAQAYVDAIQNSKTIQLKLKLDQAKSVLQKFLSVRSLVAAYADAIAPIQHNALSLLKSLETDKDINIDLISEATCGPMALISAIECHDKDSDEGIALCDKVAEFYPGRIFAGVVANKYFIGEDFELNAQESNCDTSNTLLENTQSNYGNDDTESESAEEKEISQDISRFIELLHFEKCFIESEDEISVMECQKNQNENKKISASVFSNEMRITSFPVLKVIIQELSKRNLITENYLINVRNVPSKLVTNSLTYMLNKGYLYRYSIQPGGSFYCASKRLQKALSYSAACKLINVQQRKTSEWGESIDDTSVNVASRVALSTLYESSIMRFTSRGVKSYTESACTLTNSFCLRVFNAQDHSDCDILSGAFWDSDKDCTMYLENLKAIVSECTGISNFSMAAWDLTRAKVITKLIISFLGDLLPACTVCLYVLSEQKYYSYPDFTPLDEEKIKKDDSDNENGMDNEDAVLEEVQDIASIPSDSEKSNPVVDKQENDDGLIIHSQSIESGSKQSENQSSQESDNANEIERLVNTVIPPTDGEMYKLICSILNEEVGQSFSENSSVAQSLLLAKAASYVPQYNECKKIFTQLSFATKSPLDEIVYTSENLSNAFDEPVSNTLLISAYLFSMITPGMAYDYSLKTQLDEYLSNYGLYFPELSDIKPLFAKLRTILDVVPIGFTPAILSKLGSDSESEKYIQTIQIQARNLLTYSTPKARMKALPLLYSSCFGKNSELYQSLEYVANNDQNGLDIVILVLGEFCDEIDDSFVINDEKVQSYLDKKWYDVNGQGSSFPLDYTPRQQTIKQFHSRLEVIKSWQEHINILPGGKYDLSRLKTLRKEICDIASQVQTVFSEKKIYFKCVIIWTLQEIQKYLSSSALSKTTLFTEIAQTGVITLDESWLPIINEEFNSIKYYEPWRTVLRHILSPIRSLSDAKAEILDGSISSDLFDNLHQLELIGELTGEDLSSSTVQIETAKQSANDASKDFDDALELAFTYNRITETEKESLAAIKHKNEEALLHNMDFGIWRQFLNALYKRIDELTRERQAELQKMLDARYTMQAGRESPILIAAQTLLNEDLNFAVTEEYINRFDNGEEEFSAELQSILHDTDHFAEFISDDVYKSIYDECFRRKDSNFHNVAKEYLSHHFPKDWTSRLKDDSLRFVGGGENRSERYWPIRKGNATCQQITDLFNWLGLNVKRAERYGKTEEMFKIEVIPAPRSMADYRHPIAAFGTQSKSQMDVIILHGNIPAKQLVDKITGLGLGGVSIVILNYPITLAVRRQIAEEFHKTSGQNPFILIDQVLVIYLALHQITERLPILLKCALPFTTYQPFVRDGGSTADEMFFGRSKELADILNPNGACVVYGGRQLGKTALLERAESLFNKPENKTYAIYCNILNCVTEKQLVLKIIEDIRKKTQLSMNDCDSIEQLCNEIEGMFSKLKVEAMLLLLDETDKYLGSIANNDYVQLQPLIDLKRRTKNRFKFVLAGLHNVCRAKNATARNGVFGQLGTPLCVKPLSPTDALQLLSRPLKFLGFQIDRYPHLETILTNTNYYPGILQFFGYTLVETLSTHYGKYYRAVDGNPPYTLQDDQLGAVMNSADLNRSIRDKFRWSLELDSRYFMIARCIAILYYLSEDESNTWLGFSIEQIKDIAQDYKIICLESESDNDYHNLLDEMVEMGILSKPDDTKKLYRLRRSSFITIIGSDFDAVDADIIKSNAEEVR